MIPLATFTDRKLCDSVRTHYFSAAGWVRAEWRDVRTYTRPWQAPVYAVTEPTPDGSAWTGIITLQAYAREEVAALQALFEVLAQLGHVVPPEAVWITHELAALPLTAERSLRPLGSHPPPRPPKVMGLYVDTLKPHRSRNCQCALCAPPEEK